jgi:spore germination protein GerM
MSELTFLEATLIIVIVILTLTQVAIIVEINNIKDLFKREHQTKADNIKNTYTTGRKEVK